MVILPHFLTSNSLTYVPEPTDRELDTALLRLLERDDARNAVYATVRKAGRERTKEAMHRVRPYPLPSLDKATDWLGLVHIHLPERQTDAKGAVCFAFNAKALLMFYECYRSLRRHNADLAVVVLAVDDGAYQALKDEPGLVVVRCTPLPGNWAGQWLAGLNIAAPRLFPSVERWLMIECDMLIHGDLSGVFNLERKLATQYQEQSRKPPLQGLVTCPDNNPAHADLPTHIYGVRPQSPIGQQDMEQYLPHCGGFEGEQEWITGRTFHARLVFNGATLAGHRDAFLTLEDKLRSYWPFSRLHCEGIHGHWGDECIKVLGIEDLGVAEELPDTYNQQLYHMTDGRKPCLIEHFATSSKGLFWEAAKEAA